MYGVVCCLFLFVVVVGYCFLLATWVIFVVFVVLFDVVLRFVCLFWIC